MIRMITPRSPKPILTRAIYRVGRQPPPRKRRVTIMLDEPIIEHFKALAGERGYQTLINETLRQALRQEAVEEGLRRVIREEMARYSQSSEEEEQK